MKFRTAKTDLNATLFAPYIDNSPFPFIKKSTFNYLGVMKGDGKNYSVLNLQQNKDYTDATTTPKQNFHFITRTKRFAGNLNLSHDSNGFLADNLQRTSLGVQTANLALTQEKLTRNGNRTRGAISRAEKSENEEMPQLIRQIIAKHIKANSNQPIIQEDKFRLKRMARVQNTRSEKRNCDFNVSGTSIKPLKNILRLNVTSEELSKLSVLIKEIRAKSRTQNKNRHVAKQGIKRFVNRRNGDAECKRGDVSKEFENMDRKRYEKSWVMNRTSYLMSLRIRVLCFIME
eukprot:TRINITY_DN4845_c0_g2_i1.p1 TRINITY_DN4845_c0_g2~~TRINITY_DN4845_c0_g2_i1.p1  ORF type:complete len:315 (+),score=33.43 TRINITY_DN4845_c0_g2_i1:82-945(+)